MTFSAESSILINVDRNTISSPIEQGRTDGVGEPWAIMRHGKPLDDRQQTLLDQLPEYDSRVEVDKSGVSMMDLAALTAKTDVEYAMFTLGDKCLIVRGNETKVNIDKIDAVKMNAQGYEWTGHTHVGRNLIPSVGDKDVLNAFRHNSSTIYNSYGECFDFYKDV